MLVEEAVVAVPEGYMNGYHHAFEAGALETAESELLSQSLSRKFSYLPDAAPAKTTGPQSPQAKTTARSATETEAVGTKTADPQRRPATRKKSTPSSRPAAGRPASRYVPQAEMNAELAKLERLSRAALAGDSSALDELRTALDDCPHVWRRLADLQILVEQQLIALVASKDPLRTESFRKRCSELRSVLVERQPCSLATQMSASRVVATFMFVEFLELRALQSPADLRCIKQLEQAERRHQVAMRTFYMAKRAEQQLARPC